MSESKSERISSYRDLKAYQRSYELTLEIHKRTRQFPPQERMELSSQLRRAASSVPINIAEGYGRKRSAEDFKRFLVIALGSCNEVSVILDLALDLGYLAKEEHARWRSQYDEIGKMLNRLIQVWKSF
jgi:four helix bundle protein